METKLRAVVLTTAAFRRQVGHDPGHGLGKATPFDLRNAAERFLLVLSADRTATVRTPRSRSAKLRDSLGRGGWIAVAKQGRPVNVQRFGPLT